MNSRKLNHLNNLLRTSLGTNPQYAWCHTDSPELQHPFQVYRQALDANGKLGVEPVFDYRCECGVNVTIHSPACGVLSRAFPRCRVQPRLPDYPNRWVFCRLQIVNLGEWLRVMGHEEHYRPGLWEPQSIDGLAPPGFMILKHDPSLEATQMMIQMVKDFRTHKASELRRELEERLAEKDIALAKLAHDVAENEHIRQQQQPVGVIYGMPGAKHGNSSTAPA